MESTLGCTYLNTAELLRNELKAGTELGLELADMIKQGKVSRPAPNGARKRRGARMQSMCRAGTQLVASPAAAGSRARPHRTARRARPPRRRSRRSTRSSSC
eukprot:4231545-Prymnesium_polylepis.1